MSENQLIPVPLIYPEIGDGYTNIILIDSNVIDYQLFVSSCNSSTFPIVYSTGSSKTELLNLLSNFTTINRIALCFEGSGIPNIFLDNEPLFTNSDIDQNTNTYSDNVQFMINIINKSSIKNIDYLACNTLKYPNWVSYYGILSKETGVIVGASDNNTGNIKYGGDWVLENTGQDIELIYFTEEIGYYKYLLDIGYVSIVLTNGGLIYGTGLNGNGQLGINNQDTPKTTLQQMTNMPAGKTPVAISCGNFHTIVLMSDGSIFGTGSNSVGQLGTTASPTTSLQQMTPMPAGKTPVAISCGYSHTIVLMSDGSIFGTGSNSFGQLGISGTITTLTLMTNIPAGKTPVAISCGTYHTIVLMSDGSIFGTGLNDDGQLGTTASPTTRLQQMTNTTGKIPVAISCGGYHTIVLMSDGSIFGTGFNFNGQLGLNNNQTPKTTLQQMTNLPAGKTPVAISCGEYHTIVLMSDGSIFGTGYNFYGQLGTTASPTTSLQQMTPMPAGKTPVAISCGASHTIVLMSDGSIFGTGYNNFGQLGLGNTTSSITTLQPMLTTVNSVNIPITNIVRLMDSPYLLQLSNSVPCFKEDTKILTIDGYRPIQDLRKGDLIKTSIDGYKAIDMIGVKNIYHSGFSYRDTNKDQLYVCSQSKYPELFEDLVITGMHAILVDDFVDNEREQVINLLGDIYVTNDRFRLPACIDKRTKPYSKPGNYNIYHIALENENYYYNYGIYANGLLVETCSQIYIKEFSNMKLLN